MIPRPRKIFQSGIDWQSLAVDFPGLCDRLRGMLDDSDPHDDQDHDWDVVAAALLYCAGDLQRLGERGPAAAMAAELSRLARILQRTVPVTHVLQSETELAVERIGTRAAQRDREKQ
jgi:hypothetical protein